MSLDEYHNSDMRKAADMLCEIIDREDIDWERFDSTLARVPYINTRYEEDTILLWNVSIYLSLTNAPAMR